MSIRPHSCRFPGWSRPLPLLLLAPLAAWSCISEQPLRESHPSGKPGDLGLPADEGPPAADEGPAPVDQGTPPPLDSGVPDDAGEPEPDAGEPDGGEPTDQGMPPLDAGLPPLPVAVETVLPMEQVAAGTEVRVTCRVLDSRGREVAGVETLFLIHPETGYAHEDGSDTFVPQWAGEYLVACQAPAEGLLDATPARLVAVPGPVHTVIADVDRDAMTAGETALATCTAYDAFGNPVELEAPTLALDPPGEGITVDPAAAAAAPFAVTVTRTGFYHLTCPAAGAVLLLPATLRVEPDLPAHLAVAVSPARPLYRTGEVVTLLAEVTDIYHNPVPGAAVERSSAPAVPQFGFDRFRFDQDGRFVLTATVTGETRDGLLLSGSVTVEVSTYGPTISCTSPADGGVVDQAPGALTLTGQVADPNGVRRVLVDGVQVAVGQGGSFSTQVQTHFGINFVELLAEDDRGMQSSSFCSFLVANRWDPRDAFFGDAVTFRMGQTAIDDSTNDNNLTSLGEILRRMLNSPGLISTVNQAMLGQNPLYDDCAAEWPLVGGCMVHATVRYRDGTFSLPPPNTLSLQLVNGGLRVQASFGSANGGHPTIGLNVENSGPDVGNISVGVDYINIGMTFDAGLVGGRPAVSLRSGSESVDVGSLRYDGAWWNDWLVEIILFFGDSYFRNMIANYMKSYLRDNVDSILDGVLGNLDISTLGQQFQAPSLTGGDPVTIGVGVNFTRAEFNPQRALFGFGLRLMGPVVVAGALAGAPIPPGAVSYDPGAARALGAAVSYGVLNKALHVLFQAGYLRFDAAQVVPGLENAPAGTQLSLDVGLPPVARAGQANGELILGLGGARMVLLYPTLFDTPIEILVAAEASAGASLVGDADLQFRQVTVDRLLFRTPNVNLEPVTRVLLQDLLTDIVQHILDTTVNGALPVLPIPDFALPGSLVQFGIPAGTRMGLRQPQMETNATHFVVRGNLGER